VLSRPPTALDRKRDDGAVATIVARQCLACAPHLGDHVHHHLLVDLVPDS
jgi:hypothetical protein